MTWYFGTTVTADIAPSANTALVQAAGLTCESGIVVDALLRTGATLTGKNTNRWAEQVKIINAQVCGVMSPKLVALLG